METAENTTAFTAVPRRTTGFAATAHIALCSYNAVAAGNPVVKLKQPRKRKVKIASLLKPIIKKPGEQQDLTHSKPI
jgi:hypothetical protein